MPTHTERTHQVTQIEIILKDSDAADELGST
jgi:hypothetical protein